MGPLCKYPLRSPYCYGPAQYERKINIFPLSLKKKQLETFILTNNKNVLLCSIFTAAPLCNESWSLLTADVQMMLMANISHMLQIKLKANASYMVQIKLKANVSHMVQIKLIANIS